MFWVPLLLLAWAVAGVTCLRLCLAAVRGTAMATGSGSGEDRALTLYEAAFLSGGPGRVADVTLVAMARQRRLLLAHTGWATVVDPDGRDDMERSVIGAVGPERQSPLAPVRAAAAAADAVRGIAERLVGAGLAVPDGAGRSVADAVRQVRFAVAAVAGLGTAALVMPVPSAMPRPLVALWFALPLIFGRPVVRTAVDLRAELPGHRAVRGPSVRALDLPRRSATARRAAAGRRGRPYVSHVRRDTRHPRGE
ncbi:TIGR04222 domain-containing membrane protein [Streptomyces sp. NPDC006967]|uniref:TIGR04222 domain-containing membrane protein n=1 Tax=unclassified Streptomyces TaxID=2593676 RepID=UPI0033EFF986